eukprot:444235-Amphidinium_carterae.1
MIESAFLNVVVANRKVIFNLWQERQDLKFIQTKKMVVTECRINHLSSIYISSCNESQACYLHNAHDTARSCYLAKMGCRNMQATLAAIKRWLGHRTIMFGNEYFANASLIMGRQQIP